MLPIDGSGRLSPLAALWTSSQPQTCCVWRKALSKTRLFSYSNTLYDHTSRVQVNPRATCAHTDAHHDQRPRLHGSSPINTTPHHDIAAPRTHTFPDTARRDALYEPTNLTNLLRHHEHGRAEGGREWRRGGEEAKPEPRKSDSHGGRFGEEDWYRRIRARQAVS